jgi:hypothetical protein
MLKEITLGLVLSVGPIWAQQIGRADSFVMDVADFARSATSWRGEGTLVTKGSDGKPQAEHFRIAYQQGPQIRARLEITDGPTHSSAFAMDFLSGRFTRLRRATSE